MAALMVGRLRRVSQRTLQLRLTLLYAVPFAVCGLLLLVVPALGVRETAPRPSDDSTAVSQEVSGRPFYTLATILFAITVVVAVLVGWWIAGRFLDPLRAITATAQDISARNLDRRLPPSGRDDEFAELGRTLNDLFERLQSSFDSQRHFVANASHELRTPLAAERTLLQVALADPDATAETLRSICLEVLALGEQQERLIEALLTLARSERGIERRECFDLAGIAESVVTARRSDARTRGVRVSPTLAPAPVSGDPALVESLVANLVDNAIRHNEPGGQVTVTTQVATGRPCITVVNSGAVVPPDEVDRLFEPFQQLDAARVQRAGGRGLGLGLAIVRAIATAHGAALIPRARPEGGLDIAIHFPGTGAGQRAYPAVIGRSAGSDQ